MSSSSCRASPSAQQPEELISSALGCTLGSTPIALGHPLVSAGCPSSLALLGWTALPGRIPYKLRANSGRTYCAPPFYAKICFQTHETAAFTRLNASNRLPIRSKSVILAFFSSRSSPRIFSVWGVWVEFVRSSRGVRTEFVRSSSFAHVWPFWSFKSSHSHLTAQKQIIGHYEAGFGRERWTRGKFVRKPELAKKPTKSQMSELNHQRNCTKTCSSGANSCIQTMACSCALQRPAL